MEEHKGFSFDQEIEKITKADEKRNITFYSGVKNVELAENENGVECSFVSEKMSGRSFQQSCFIRKKNMLGI